MREETSEDLAWACYCANKPFDYQVIKSLTYKGRVRWAKEQVRIIARLDCSENKLTRAAKHLLRYIGL